MAKEYYIRKSRLIHWLQFLLVAIYFLAMNWLYPAFVVHFYEYMGFTSDGVSLSEGLVLVSIFGLSNVYFAVSLSGFLKNVCAIFQVAFLIPNLIIWAHMEYSLQPTFAVLLLLFLLSWDGLKLPRIKTKILSIQEQSLLIVAIAILAFLPFAFFYRFHFDPKLFAFGKEIYEVRRQVSEVKIPLLGYLFSPYVKVLLPMAVAYAMLNKKYVLGCFALALMVLMFTMSPHKSIIFAAVVVLGLAILRRYDVQLLSFLGGVLSIFLIGTILAGNGELLLNSLIVRRVFFLPAYLNLANLEFFEGEQLSYSYSFLSRFFEYPYPYDPPHMIGLAYFDSETVNANSGFLSDTFINLGSVGLFAISVVIALIFKFFDSLKIHAAYFGLFFLYIFTLLNSSFFTSLLTHGGIALIIVALFLLNKTKRLALVNTKNK